MRKISPTEALEAINLLILFGKQDPAIGKFEGVLLGMEERLQQKYRKGVDK